MMGFRVMRAKSVVDYIFMYIWGGGRGGGGQRCLVTGIDDARHDDSRAL